MGLDGIAFAGSAGFLVIFAMVSLAGYRLRREVKVNPVLEILGFLSSLTALVLLLYHTMVREPVQVALFIILLSASFTVEGLYRRLTGRRLSHIIDSRLAERERLKREWRKWVPHLIDAIGQVLKEFEVYLVGGIARGEVDRSHDVDLLVVSREKIRVEELEEKLVDITGFRMHPIHIHIAKPEEREKWLRKSGEYRRLGGKSST